MLFENDYREILDAIPDPVFVSEAVFNDAGEITDFIVVYINPSYTKSSCGLIPLRAMYSQYEKQMVSDPPEDWICHSASILKSHSSYETEFLAKATRTWYHLSVRTYKNKFLIGTLLDITASKIRETCYTFIEQKDALTGLSNRISFYKASAEAINHAAVRAAMFALYIIDIDDMKFINDISGHDEGDHILKKCADILLKDESYTVHAFRLGDDEFVVLKTDVRSSEDFSKFAKLLFADFIDNGIRISMGISIYPQHETNVSMLMKYADLALRYVKHNGKCDYAFFESDMYEKFMARIQMKSKIVKSLGKGDFELYYQPQFKISDNKLRGFEALLRWHDGTEWHNPADFIPLAEETNMIIPLGHWVLDTAISSLRHWQKEYDFKGTLSVNVSPIQLKTPGFIKELWILLQKYKIQPNSLEIEITEGYLIGDICKAVNTLTMIRKMGVYIALDDFGTGYASLKYLNSLPITTLKIDKTFIDKLSSEQNVSTDIMSSIISILSGNGIETIAEGVERSEQMAMIKELNFCNVQGFLSGRPMPREACELYIKKAADSAAVPQLEAVNL